VKINKSLIFLCFVILLVDSTVFAQSLTNKPVFETNSIKVVTNDKFPQDLESEIFVGPKGSPYFYAEGKRSELHAATIEMSADGSTSISAVQKEGETNSYALCLFSYDAAGKVVFLVDLNMDGVWDVKRTPTSEQKNFIFLDNHWVAVARIDRLISSNPTAEGLGIRYEFHNGWKTVK
jgi:hypothetical protein